MKIIKNYKGPLSMVVAAFFCTLIAIFALEAKKNEPLVSFWAGSFIRVLVNCVFVLLLFRKRMPLVLNEQRIWLWCWGFSGAFVVLTYYLSVFLVGVGTSGILHATSGAILVALSPWVLKQRVFLSSWLAVLGSFLGVLLILLPTSGKILDLGMGMGILCAAFTAFAYISVAKLGVSVSPILVMGYWSFCCLISHGILFSFLSTQWPTSLRTLVFLVLSGIVATLCQYFSTLAYRWGPTCAVTALTYLTPVFSMFWDKVIYQLKFSLFECMGTFLVVVCGILLSYLTREKNVEVGSVLPLNLKSKAAT